jgi:hypothetical protein
MAGNREWRIRNRRSGRSWFSDSRLPITRTNPCAARR